MDLRRDPLLGYWSWGVPHSAQYVLAQSQKAHNHTVSVLTAARDEIEYVHLDIRIGYRVLNLRFLASRNRLYSTP